MPIIRFGPWRPDAAALDVPVTVLLENLRPGTNGFRPVRQPASATQAIPGTDDVVGAATALDQAGGGRSFVGTTTKLWELAAGGDWTDRTRSTGGDYAVPTGNRWRAAQFTNLDTSGDLAIFTNGNDPVQKLDLTSGTNFEDLGGNPAPHRYIATFGSRVLLAHQLGGTPRTNRISWSAPQNPEIWDGSSLSGFQGVTPGGPITGLMSGEVAHIFQRGRISRMINRPDDNLLKVQIDSIEENRGLEAENSLVQYGSLAFFRSQDGFYAINARTSQMSPIGNQKVDEFFRADVAPNTDPQILAGIDPLTKTVFWPYVSNTNTTLIPDSVMIYDWGRGEWGHGTFSVLALSAFITQGFHLDNIDGFGTLDELPFTLDSPFWTSGQSILGIISIDRKLSNATGDTLPAQIDTRESAFDDVSTDRVFVSGVAPLVDALEATVSIATRDRLGDPIVYGPDVAMEPNGVCPQHSEGQLMRARIKIPGAVDWTLLEGLDPQAQSAGSF